MEQAVNLWPLIGIAAIVVGFILRFNPVLVVIAAGIITGLAALMPLDVILEKLGEGFLNTRNLPLILLLPLAVIGLLERHGLKERAQAWIAKIKKRHRRPFADRIPVRARDYCSDGADQPGRASADGAAAAGADGGRSDGKPLRRAAGAHPPPSARHVGRDRQRRAVLRRRYLRRLRRDHLHAQLYAGVRRHSDRAAAYRAVGHSDRDFRFPDPRVAAVSDG